MTLIGLILAWNVIRKDPRYLVNRLVALGLLILGISMLFFAGGNVPIILCPECDNTFVIVTSIRIFLSLLPIIMVCFLLTALALFYGNEYLRSPILAILLTIFVVINEIIPWLPDSVVPVGTEGDITTGDAVIFFGFPTIMIVYLATFYYFFQLYGNLRSNDPTRRNMRSFLLGWLIAGFSIIIAGLSNVVNSREMDLIGPFVLAWAMVVLQNGFRKTNQNKAVAIGKPKNTLEEVNEDKK